MPLLLLWHPGVEGEPPEPPVTAPATPIPDMLGGAWPRPSEIQRKRRRDRQLNEDKEIQALMGALAGQLMIPSRKLATDEDLLVLIRELAPDFMKTRRRIQ